MNSVLQKQFLSESKCLERKSNSAFITTFIFIFEHTISLHSHDIKHNKFEVRTKMTIGMFRSTERNLMATMKCYEN